MEISPVQAMRPALTFSAHPVKGSTPPEKSDTVTISAQGRAHQANLSGDGQMLHLLDSFMDGAGKDGVITGDEIRAYAEKYSQTTRSIFAETLAQLGISNSHDITVRTDGQGTVRVTSNLSKEDNQRLEAALNRHPEFQQSFVKASNGHLLSKMADTYDDFLTAYEKNPRAALAQYRSSFNGEYFFEFRNGESGFEYENRMMGAG